MSNSAVTKNTRYAVPEILGITEVEGDFELRTIDSIFTVPFAVKDAILKIHESVGGIEFSEKGLEEDSSLALLPELLNCGLVVELAGKKSTLNGKEFYANHFSKSLDFWLDEAFSHKSWAGMMEGRENKSVFIGWMFELFHYTKNANKHMPLAVAYCKHKKVKEQLAIHYKEEWNHYHFFRKSLESLGFTREEVENSDPLPMTEEMSNFMREAARTDFMAYAACSAVLEGTTTDNKTYDNFYKVMQEKYDIPYAAIKPIYDHLALDQQYDHANLFEEICESVGEITNERAELIMTYARMMSEHILAWSSNIAEYYSSNSVSLPRLKPTYLDI